MIEKKLDKIISKSLKIPLKKINNKISPDNCEEWDSFNFLSLIVNIEKGFNIKFNYNEMISLRNYKNILKLIKKKTKNKN